MFKDYIASDLFDIKKGKRLTKANMVEGGHQLHRLHVKQ